MKIEPPAAFVVVEIGKGCIIVIPERVFMAGVKLGKMLRRRQEAGIASPMRSAPRSTGKDSRILGERLGGSSLPLTIMPRIPAGRTLQSNAGPSVTSPEPAEASHDVFPA